MSSSGAKAGGYPLNLTGATTPTRYVGGTTGGAPTAGTFDLGDLVVDDTGKLWVCTAAGTPGTWAAAGGGALNLSPFSVNPTWSTLALTANNTNPLLETPSLNAGTWAIVAVATFSSATVGAVIGGTVQNGTAIATYGGASSPYADVTVANYYVTLTWSFLATVTSGGTLYVSAYPSAAATAYKAGDPAGSGRATGMIGYQVA